MLMIVPSLHSMPVSLMAYADVRVNYDERHLLWDMRALENMATRNSFQFPLGARWLLQEANSKRLSSKSGRKNQDNTTIATGGK